MNQMKQNIFSFFVLSLFLKNMILIITIITKPIKVLRKEKLGIGTISKSRKNFAKDSGIVRIFDMNAVKPNTASSPWFEILPIAFERSQNQKIPDIT